MSAEVVDEPEWIAAGRADGLEALSSGRVDPRPAIPEGLSADEEWDYRQDHGLHAVPMAPTDPVPGRREVEECPTWAVHDLGPVLAGSLAATVPTVLARNDGAALFYAAKINSVHGDSGTGKSMLAQETTHQYLDGGGSVLWLDFEDANPALLVERLRGLGVTDQAMGDRLHYVNPDEIPTHDTVDRLVGQLPPGCLVVIDSVGESLGLMGLSEDKDLEVDQWKRLIAHRFERAGHTVLLVDHSTKAGDNPLYPSGSKRKRALVSGASWLVETVTPFSRTHPGKLKLTCAKDRHGNYRRSEVGAWVHIDPTRHPLQVYLEAPEVTDMVATPVTVLLVKRVIEATKVAGQAGVTGRKLRPAVRAKGSASNQAVDDAAELADTLGCISITDGQRGARVHRWLRDPTDDELEGLTR